MKHCAVAEKTDLSVKAFSDIMHGRKILKVEYIPRFAMALDVSIEELFKENCSVSIVKKGQKQSRIVQNASRITAVFEIMCEVENNRSAKQNEVINSNR